LGSESATDVFFILAKLQFEKQKRSTQNN